MTRLSAIAKRLVALEPRGRVTGVIGPVVRACGVEAMVGQQVDLWPESATRPLPAEVIGLENDELLLMSLGGLEGVGPGCEVSLRDEDTLVPMGSGLLGRIVDGLGNPLDGAPLPRLPDRRFLRGQSPSPLSRSRIREQFSTGVRAVDAMVAVGQGQRMGIFAGAGVGKSTLLSMMARHSEIDTCVVGLIGERGREVREFVEDTITERNRDRTLVVAVTGDQAPLTRIRGGLLAVTAAEYFRAKGHRVLLLFDSLTRYAMALREVGLARGELPATKGYPPSVFMEFSRLLERAGNDEHGSITGIYTVLVEGDDMSDPIADSTLALLDGHLILSRELANRGLYPPIDVLKSTSRLMQHIASGDHVAAAQQTMAVLAAYKQAEDLIRIGAYQQGSDPVIDAAQRFLPHFEQFLAQLLTERYTVPQSKAALFELVGRLQQASPRGR